MTGRPLSHRQVQFDEPRPERRCRVMALAWSRAELHARIDGRVDQMFAAGWVAEVRRLLESYPVLGRTAAQAVGYREIIEYLQGKQELRQTMELVKRQTRQFARRQDTWFRSLSECRRIDPVSLPTQLPSPSRSWRRKPGEGRLGAGENRRDPCLIYNRRSITLRLLPRRDPSASSRLRIGVAVSERQGIAAGSERHRRLSALPLTTHGLSLDNALASQTPAPAEADGHQCEVITASLARGVWSGRSTANK